MWDPAMVRRVAEGRSLTKLRHLDMSYNRIQCRGAFELAGGLATDQLTELSLEGCGIKDDGAAALAEAKHLSGLTHLKLGGHRRRRNKITAVGIKALAQGLPRLVSLGLSEAPVGADGAEALAASSLRHLRTLDLCSCRLGEAGGRAVLNAPWLDQLTELDVSFNGFSRPLKTEFRSVGDHIKI